EKARKYRKDLQWLEARFLADTDLRLVSYAAFEDENRPLTSCLQGLIPESMGDFDVLALAANLERVLVSHDYDTMPGHFYRLSRRGNLQGSFSFRSSGRLVWLFGELQIVWACAEAQEFRN